MDPSIKVETQIIELPHDENKLFDEEDDLGTPTIPDLSLTSEDEEEEIKANNVWEHAIDVLFKLATLHNEGKSLRKWVNADNIKKTFENSTQWAVTSTRFSMRKNFKSMFPAYNIPCRNEAVATDTIFSDTPAIDSGVIMAKVFVGKDSLVSDVYPIQSSKQCVHSLEDNIGFRGALSKLINDYAQVEISNKVKDILRMYNSSSWHSKPYHQ